MTDNTSNQMSDVDAIVYPEKLSSRQIMLFSSAGLLFIIAALGCLLGLGWYLFMSGDLAYKPYMMSQEKALAQDDLFPWGMIDYYFSVFFKPLMWFVAATFSAFIGFLLFRTSGTSNRDIIPRQDYELISKMLISQNERGIDHYIRLSSLTGITGVFTKVGLTGLPLATIVLTIFLLAYQYGVISFSISLSLRWVHL